MVTTLKFYVIVANGLFLFLFWSIAYITDPFNDRENKQRTMKCDISPVLYMPPGAKTVIWVAKRRNAIFSGTSFA